MLVLAQNASQPVLWELKALPQNGGGLPEMDRGRGGKGKGKELGPHNSVQPTGPKTFQQQLSTN